MAAYAIFYVEEISDRAILKEYQRASAPTLEPYGGRVIVAYGQSEVVEGEPLAGVVTIEFPDYQHASDWYHSEAYQQAKAIRLRGVRCHTVLIDGK